MADHPILFSAPMVRALLEGRKTQTRRILRIRGHVINRNTDQTEDQTDRTKLPQWLSPDEIE